MNKIIANVVLLFLLSGCATVSTRIDATDTYPGYTMQSTVFGSAKMLEAAQEFHGNLVVSDGKISVEISNGQASKGMEASGIQEITKGVVDGVLTAIFPVRAPLEPLLP